MNFFRYLSNVSNREILNNTYKYSEYMDIQKQISSGIYHKITH